MVRIRCSRVGSSLRSIFFFLFISLLAVAAHAQSQVVSGFNTETQAKLDQIAQHVLAATGVPSASVAVVKDGRIAYLKAYGDARLEPRIPARSDMRYSIGSISKQFTAAAILMLAEEGKLSLDDKVARFVPNVTRGNETTIRQLLSHTSGYQDDWPQDYVPAFMLHDVSVDRVLDWARKPLDFEPGTQYQYSNTGYAIAGLIVERASGMPFMEFLRARILRPLGMKSVMDVDQSGLTESDPTGYLRYALGPARVAPKEGKGWLFAMGELAMTAEDLAKWDISLIDRTLLKPGSYDQMERVTVLKNGLPTGYGLGVQVGRQAGHRALSHGGEVSGFTAQNVVFPDDRAAIVVLTNQDAATATGPIVREITALLFPASAEASEKTKQMRSIFEGLQRGKIDRTLFTENGNGYFTEQALHDFASSLGSLGTPLEFAATGQQPRGGKKYRSYRVSFLKNSVSVWVREMPDGKIEQYQVMAAE